MKLQKEDEQNRVFFTEGSRLWFGLPETEKERDSSLARSFTNKLLQHLNQDRDMIKLLFFLFLVATTDPNGTFGKPIHGDFRSILQVDFSDSADPGNDFQVKRNSYHAGRLSEMPHLADPSSLCYFIQESTTESQISCRLRFTRSKFNFNPFGLRFGKRQESILAGDRELVSRSSSDML